MNRHEAQAVIEYLSASFPRDPMVEGEVVVWAETLAPFGREIAMDAIRHLRENTADRLPSHRQFREVAFGLRRRDEARAVQGSLEAGYVDPKDATENIARLREIITKVGPKHLPRQPKPEREERVLPRAEPCAEADHSRCGSGPVRS